MRWEESEIGRERERERDTKNKKKILTVRFFSLPLPLFSFFPSAATISKLVKEIAQGEYTVKGDGISLIIDCSRGERQRRSSAVFLFLSSSSSPRLIFFALSPYAALSSISSKRPLGPSSGFPLFRFFPRLPDGTDAPLPCSSHQSWPA